MIPASSSSLAADAAALLRARYRDTPPLAAIAQWNAVLGTLLAHRSVRAFLPDSLPPGAIELLIAAAQSASTSCNFQMWSVIVVEDPSRKARLSTIAASQEHIRQCPVFLVWLADLARIEQMAAERGETLACLGYLETFLVAVIDAALAAQSALVAAESMGLGGVYVGALRNQPDAVAAELGLPPRVFPVFGMSLGHPDPAKPTDVKPRLPNSVVVHRERYSFDRLQTGVASYDAAYRQFQQEQQLASVGWIANVFSRLRDVDQLFGRDRLKQIIQDLGFGLK
jgi:nitroreductase